MIIIQLFGQIIKLLNYYYKNLQLIIQILNMDKKLQRYKKRLNDLESQKDLLDTQIDKTMKKIKDLDLIINPPWWTNLDDKFSIFQGLIKNCESDEEHNGDHRPVFSEYVLIQFINGSSVCYNLDDEYDDGSHITACIDGFDDYKNIRESLANVLVSLKIKASDRNVKKLLDLLEYASIRGDFSDKFKGFYKND